MGKHAKADCRLIGEGVHFQRIRRITGYLVGDMTRWNSAKRAEEHERVKHLTGQQTSCHC